MSWSLRRAVLVLTPLCLLCSAALLQAVHGQGAAAKQIKPALPPVPPGGPATPPAPKEPGDFIGIDLPKDPDKAQQIQAAEDYIQEADWKTAVTTLQKLLAGDQDCFTKVIRKGTDGKEVVTWVSVKAEANRLIATLPKEGMEFYKLTFGHDAGETLKKAKEDSDPAKLATVMRLYLHTDAGAEATNLLGTYYLDRGEFTAAAVCFEKLFQREGADKLSPVTLFKAAYAFHMAGGDSASDKANEAVCWQKLGTRVRDLRVGNETKTLDELRDYVAKASRSAGTAYTDDYPMVGGGPTRAVQALKGGPAFLEAVWRTPVSRSEESRGWIKQAEKILHERGVAFLPSMQPITATVQKDDRRVPLVVFRSYWGVHAADMRTGKIFWEALSKGSPDRMVKDTKTVGLINGWVQAYLTNQVYNPYGGQVQYGLRPTILFDNSTVGTLSTDGTLVYAVEDLYVPPAVNPQQMWNGGGGVPMKFNDPETDKAVHHSRLQAFNLVTGKLVWEVGGFGDKDDLGRKTELPDSYFLGPPLPMGGKLYVLTEKQQDLRLACIDPTTGKVLTVQTLATAREKMQMDVARRIQAAQLAYGEGILVCPTNSGAVLGVDLLTNSLVWAYPYRDKAQGPDNPYGDQLRPIGKGGVRYQPNLDLHSQWKNSPPVVVDGKVVFTAPDATALHCINLRDGSAVWQKPIPRGTDDLYFAGVFAGKAVVVGKRSVKGISLAKGEKVWEVETGVPAGFGVASDNVYYLPLKEAGQNKEPEICAIDVDKGQVVAHTKSRKKEVPGNLLFYEGNVLSQTPTELAAFPQLAVQLAKADDLLRANPSDPVGLFARGQLRLDKGDLAGAIDDLRESLRNKPDDTTQGQAREKLYDTFTEYFQRDFNRAEKYLKEYEELCSLDLSRATTDSEKETLKNEERRRRANFLCLVAKGRETQGRLVDAFEKYQEFGTLAAGQELITVVDEPTVKAAPEVWSGGRIAAMVANATPENRKPLEALLTRKWEELRKTEDVNEVRKFVRVFGSLFTVGKEARLELANRLMKDSAPAALLEAEQQLSLLRVPGEDPKLAGRAVEALARLNTSKGLLEDASYFYRLLRDEYARVPVRDGKTGGDLFNEMATDKRLLPHLDIPMKLGVNGRISAPAAEEVRGTFPMQNQTYTFEHVGEKLPYFQRHRLALQFGNPPHLRLFDRSNNDDKLGNLAVDLTNFQNMAYGNGQPNLPRHGYMTLGHLIVLPMGHLVLGIDPLEKRVLWKHNLFGDKTPQGNGVPQYTQFMVDPRDHSILLTYADGWVQRIGGAGTLEGSALCLQVREGLVAVDPVTGKTLWTRSGVSSRSQIFNDDRHIYLVEQSADGASTSTRVLRAYDGVTVNVPDFAAQYQKRVRMVGRHLLLSETDARGAVTLKLYDVLAGKDLWSTTFPANSVVLKSEDPNFSGVVDPEGKVRVVDLRTGKDALTTKMDPAHLAKVNSVHLLYDGKYFFVACNGPIDPNLQPFGGVQPNLMPGTGMRSLPVNGWVYAFDGATGKLKWRYDIPNQMIVLDHFADIPVVFFTARYNAWVNLGGGGRQVQNVVEVKSIEKSSGKFKFDAKNQNWQQFHALNIDPKQGTFELVNYTTKIVHRVERDGETPASGGGK